LPLFQVIVLAVVQGFTEFLPISSTAHLVIVPRVLHWQDPGLGFDIALHLGTLVAVIAYFFPTWISFIRALLFGRSAEPTVAPDLNSTDSVAGIERRLVLYLALATLPGAVAGFFLRNAAETSLRNLLLIGSMMVIVGLYMWFAEVVSRRSKAMSDIRVSDALSVGIAQAFAIVPGVSRSGSTIGTGLLRGMHRDSATRFSFLLSTPIIAGATLLEGSHLLRAGIPSEMRLPFALGILVSAVSGYVAIWALIRYLQSRSLMVFVVYRIVLGIILIVTAVTPTI
jgi:undecaprenyl-diphosphatase